MNTPTPTPTSHQLAAELSQLFTVLPFLENQLRRAYEIVNTPGQEQEILDLLPLFQGINAAKAVSAYAALQPTLMSLDLGVNLPAVVRGKFTANADGSVTVTTPEPAAPIFAPTPEP